MTAVETPTLTEYSVHYNSISANDVDIFYREAGPKSAPVILLLHSFPTSSNMFRNLIPRLAVLLVSLVSFGISNLEAQSVAPKFIADQFMRLKHGVRAPQGPFSGLLNPDAEYTDLQAAMAVAINDFGDVVGLYCLATPQCSATTYDGNGPFVFSQGTYKNLTFPPVVIGVTPAGINLLDQIVGTYYDQKFALHGFLLEGSRFTSLDAPGSGPGTVIATMVNGINTQGDIVGQYYDQSFNTHDFIYRNGRFVPFTLPIAAADGDTPNAINDRGEIVGYYYDKTGTYHGYLLSNGVAQTIDFPGATSTQAYGINFEGDIVGFYTVPSTNPYVSVAFYGFLLHSGKFTTINPPKGSTAFDGVATMAFGINDFGVIVGTYQLATGPGSAGTLGFLRRW